MLAGEKLCPCEHVEEPAPVGGHRRRWGGSGNVRRLGVIGIRQDPRRPRYGAFSIPYTEPETGEEESVWHLLSLLSPHEVYSTTLMKCPLVPKACSQTIQKPGARALDVIQAEESCSKLLLEELSEADLWLGVGMEVALRFLSGWKAKVVERWTWPRPHRAALAYLVRPPFCEADILLLPSPSEVSQWPEEMLAVLESIRT